jgi:galactokinase
MNSNDLLARLESPEAAVLFERLYGAAAVDKARERLRSLILATVQAFPETADGLRVFSAPGRTELGGNHTDHNRGKVLAASIQLDALACASPRADGKVVFRSGGYPDVVVDLADLSPRRDEEGTTEALVRGIAAEFVARGTPVGGFTANAVSTVLSGSGLSSSAAIEVLFGAIFDGLYGGGKRSAVELAQIGQKAENVYFGKPCGLMDQVACASGGAVAIDFADPVRRSCGTSISTSKGRIHPLRGGHRRQPR